MRREVEVVTIRRMARKPCKLLGEQHTKLYSSLEKQAKESMAKYQVVKAGGEKLTNGDKVEKADKSAAEVVEAMDNDESSESNEKKTTTTTTTATEAPSGEVEGESEMNGDGSEPVTKTAAVAANGGSVVVLD